MKREKIEEGLKILKGWRVTHFQKGKRNESEEAILAWFIENGEELCKIALRATEPDMVMVPIADIIDVGKEPFKDGACEQCYPQQDYTKPGFRCIYHEAADKYRANFQEDQP